MLGHGSLRGDTNIHGMGRANLPRIEFPKMNFSMKQVVDYRDTKLQYPKAYNLFETKKDWVLEFDKKLHEHHYGSYSKANMAGNIKMSALGSGYDDPRRFMK